MQKNKKIIITVACAVVLGGIVAGVSLAHFLSDGTNAASVQSSSSETKDVKDAEKKTAESTSENSTDADKDKKTASADNEDNKKKTADKITNASTKTSSKAKKATGSKKSSSSTKPNKSTGLKQKYLNELASVSKEEEQIYYDLKHPKENEPLTEGNPYSLWDEELNKVYNVTKANITKTEFSKLEKSEMSWIKQKEKLNDINALAKETKNRCYYIVNNYMPK